MKKLFTSFFQILFLLQVVGYSQLNAHPMKENASSVQIGQWTVAADHAGAFHVQNGAASGIKTCTSPSSHSRKIVRLVAENIDEEEYELVSVKKQVESNACFSIVFYTQLPEYLYHNGQNSSAFCKQLSFNAIHERHLVFQVFRI